MAHKAQPPPELHATPLWGGHGAAVSCDHLQGDIRRVREAETDAGRSRVELTTTYVQGCQACRAKQTAFEVQVTSKLPAPASPVVRPPSPCLLPAPCLSACTRPAFKCRPAGFLCQKASLPCRWGVQWQSASTGQTARPLPLRGLAPGRATMLGAPRLAVCRPLRMSQAAGASLGRAGATRLWVACCSARWAGRRPPFPFPPLPDNNGPTHHQAFPLVDLSLATRGASAVCLSQGQRCVSYKFVACRQELQPPRPAGASLTKASLLASKVRNLALAYDACISDPCACCRARPGPALHCMPDLNPLRQAAATVSDALSDAGRHVPSSPAYNFGWDVVFAPFANMWRRDLVGREAEYYNTSQVLLPNCDFSTQAPDAPP